MTPATQPLWICTNCGKKNNTNPLRCPACGWDEFTTSMTPAPSPSDEQCRICSEAIAAQAREKVLDKLEIAFKTVANTGRETQYELGFRQGMTHAICEIKSLRTEAPKEQQR